MLVVRDILHPWNDPVRTDGLSDDPLGGVLDEGIDSEPPGRAADEPVIRPWHDEAPASGDAEEPDRDPIYAR